MLASTLAFTGSASAVALIGNYPPTNDLEFSFIIPSLSQAHGFTLPTGSNYNLDNIVLRLELYQSSTDTPLLQIYADPSKTSTNPNGASLQSVTFTKPTSSSDAINNFTFRPTGAFTFLADTRYWLRLSESTEDLFWVGSDPGITPTGISGITFNGARSSFDGGATYLNSGIFNTFQINATAVATTAVPEPFTIIGTIIGGTAAFRLRKKLRDIDKN